MLPQIQRVREPEEFKPTKREDIDLAKPPEKPKPVEEEVIAPEEEKEAYQRAPKEKEEEVTEEKELIMGKAVVSIHIKFVTYLPNIYQCGKINNTEELTANYDMTSVKTSIKILQGTDNLY